MTLHRLSEHDGAHDAGAVLPGVEVVDRLASEALVDFATQAAALHARAMARLAAAAAVPASASIASPGSGALLTVREAAARLHKSETWLYRHAKRLPFIRRVGTRALNIDAAALERWLAKRPP